MAVIEGRLKKMGLPVPQPHPLPSSQPYRMCARAAIGIAELPRGAVLEIMGELELKPGRAAGVKKRAPARKVWTT